MDGQVHEARICPTADAILDLMRDYSIEVTPGAASKVLDFRKLLKSGQSVAVTFFVRL